MSLLVIQGLLLGWSVAWPPGPINTEILRRGIHQGFGPAFLLGLGACLGDFTWALIMSTSLSAFAQRTEVHQVVVALSSLLLLYISYSLFRKWRKEYQDLLQHKKIPTVSLEKGKRNGFLWGLMLALTGSWNIAFWFAVIGENKSVQGNFASSVTLAAAVVAGAGLWTFVAAASSSLGKNWIKPSWQVHASLATALLMLVFGVKSLVQFF